MSRKSEAEGIPQGPSLDSEFERTIGRLLSKPQKKDDFYVAEEPLVHSADSMPAIQKLRTKVINSVAHLPIDQAISEAERMLRSQNDVHFKFIFPAGNPDAPDSENDSLYFVSDDQYSIRLKRADRSSNDISQVIKSVKEIIVFEDEKRNISFEPERGLHVYEYSSKEFVDMQEGVAPFRECISRKSLGLTQYGNIVVLGKREPGDVRHRGHRVNNIRAISVMTGAPSRLKR